jgi:hypothetical protein
MRIFASKYSLECEGFVKVLRIFAAKTITLKQIFAGMSKCEANFCSELNFCFNMYFLHQIKYLYANLCEYFKANKEQMRRINGVCEYTETCEYEVNEIHIRLDSLRSE